METAATLRYARISAQKGRLVADQVRGLPVDRALNLLAFSNKKAAELFKKEMESALANAEHTDGADVDELKVTKVFVDEGPSQKRIRPRAKGRTNRILKRTSHITVVVGDKKREAVHGSEGQSNRYTSRHRQGLDLDVVCRFQAIRGLLYTDLKVREFLRKKLANASVSRIQIERPARTARITIHSARPGIVIGKKGEDIEALRKEISGMMGVPVHINVEEIRKPEMDAQLVAESIAQQLERRIMFRRAMKRAVTSTMRLGAQGIKINVGGRLGGAEIARTEW